MEIWKDIPGYPGYKISNIGRVFSKRVGIMKLGKNKKGYFRVELSGGKKLFVSRLVATAFIGKIPHRHVVCHKNDIPSDNRVENLFIGTYSDNLNDAYAKFRKKSQKAKLTKEKVLSIYYDHSGESYVSLGKKYGVNRQSISGIKNGRYYRFFTQKKAPSLTP